MNLSFHSSLQASDFKKGPKVLDSKLGHSSTLQKKKKKKSAGNEMITYIKSKYI